MDVAPVMESRSSHILERENSAEDIVSALGELKHLVRISNEQEQWFEEKLACVSQQVRTVSTEAASLKQEVERMDNEIDALRKFVSERIAILESVSLEGGLSMIAVYVEQAICSYVLPEVFMNNSSASLHDLLNFLNSDDTLFPLDPKEYDCKKILCEARKRWAIVCKDFKFPDEWKTRKGGWKVFDCTVPGDIRAIDVLKMCGVRINFPNPISLRYAEQNVESMKDELPPWQFKLVATFIGSLREKMIKNGLHHDYILLD
jgi:hypothetical protein